MTAIVLRCGHSQDVREAHKANFRAAVRRQTGQDLPLQIQRSVWFTSTASFERHDVDAIGVVLHIDRYGQIVPAAAEDGIELTKLPEEPREPIANIAVVLSKSNGLPLLALCDALPRYLYMVSGLPTALLVAAEAEDIVNAAFGWQRIAATIETLPGFVSMNTDANPVKSICARAVLLGRPVPGTDNVFMDSVGRRADPPMLFVNDDVRQLTTRAWQDWDPSFDRKIEIEVVQPEEACGLPPTADVRGCPAK